MNGLDTNVLVRYLIKDDPAQARKAAAFIRTHCTQASPCMINRIVLCELVWVLDVSYGYDRETIAGVLEKILRTHQFIVEDIDTAWAAWRDFRRSKADFADCLIGRINRAHGCEDTASFDRQAGGLDTFTRL